MSRQWPSLTVVVLALDEEANLPACLASLHGLRATLVVVDSGSTDHTLDIAKQAGAVVLSHPFENYAAQRNWAQDHLPASTDWILHLDADERLTAPLVQEINTVLGNQLANVDGFMLRKRTVFLGRWIKHGGHYPAYHLRLFRSERGRCEDRLYDQHFVVQGPTGQLRHDYVDVLTSDLTTWTQRHARWADLEARELQSPAAQAQVRSALLGNPIERRRWLRTGVYGHAPLFLRAFMYWFYRYVIRRGFLDGQEGLIFHFLQGFWFRFLIDAKIFERRRITPASLDAGRSAASNIGDYP